MPNLNLHWCNSRPLNCIILLVKPLQMLLSTEPLCASRSRCVTSCPQRHICTHYLPEISVIPLLDTKKEDQLIICGVFRENKLAITT